MKTDLSAYNNAPYHPGGNAVKRLVWFYINALFFKTSLLPFSRIKCMVLRWFGAAVGKGVVIKPGVNIKYPWHLVIGNHCWIGEGVWIDNLVRVTLGSHVCLSQGALLLTGNHNYSKPGFDLITGTITLADGAWIGARATVCPGTVVHSHAVLTAGSIATSALAAYGIHQGNPATLIRKRVIG